MVPLSLGKERHPLLILSLIIHKNTTTTNGVTNMNNQEEVPSTNKLVLNGYMQNLLNALGQYERVHTGILHLFTPSAIDKLTLKQYIAEMINSSSCYLNKFGTDVSVSWLIKQDQTTGSYEISLQFIVDDGVISSLTPYLSIFSQIWKQIINVSGPYTYMIEGINSSLYEDELIDEHLSIYSEYHQMYEVNDIHMNEESITFSNAV